MKKLNMVTVFAISPLVFACTNFTDISYTNKDVPDYFSARDFVSYEQLGPLGGSIDWFAGRLGYKRNDGKFVFTERLVVGSPDLKVVTLEKSPNYHSVLDKGFTASATLPMLKGDASGNTATDYEITDVTNIVVPDGAKPNRTAATAAVPELPRDRALWWVNAVGLRVIRYSSATNTKGATTLSGSAYSANGTIYDNQTVGAYLPLVSVLVQPMNATADTEMLSVPKPPAPQPPAVADTQKSVLQTMNEATADIVLGSGQLQGRLRPQYVPPPQWQALLTKDKPGLLDWTTQPY